MSYLNVPRLHFAGQFIANISTVNNTPYNYDPSVPITPRNELFNPDGSGNWEFQNCAVSRVTYLDGSHCDDASSDKLVGQPVASNSGTPAKLVDLDPEQQLVSEIWGLRLQIGTSANGGSVTGDYAVAAFFDLWQRAQGQGGGDIALAASYQSVLEKLSWDVAGSRFLEELQSASPDLLSIKFNVDGVAVNGKPTGRIVGTIGPAAANEPKHFVAGRLLRANVGSNATAGSPLYFAPCQVDEARGVVAVDLGNSIPTINSGGDPSNEGELSLARLPAGQDPESIGKIDYLSPGIYSKTAFVQEFPVDVAAVKDTPLGIVRFNPENHPGFVKMRAVAPHRILLQENADGSYVRAEPYVFRLNPGDPKSGQASTELYLRKFGRPVQGETVTLAITEGQLQAWPRLPLNTPAGAISFPATTGTTDADGKVSFEMTSSDPGNPRQYIDGQVYGIAYSWGVDELPDPWNFISILIHTKYEYTGTPTWNANVGPILSQYKKLYPFMLNFLDLSSYESVTQNASSLERVLRLPMADPAFMPVTRDLSQTKLDMILAWFAAGMPES